MGIPKALPKKKVSASVAKVVKKAVKKPPAQVCLDAAFGTLTVCLTNEYKKADSFGDIPHVVFDYFNEATGLLHKAYLLFERTAAQVAMKFDEHSLNTTLANFIREAGEYVLLPDVLLRPSQELFAAGPFGGVDPAIMFMLLQYDEHGLSIKPHARRSAMLQLRESDTYFNLALPLGFLIGFTLDDTAESFGPCKVGDKHYHYTISDMHKRTPHDIARIEYVEEHVTASVIEREVNLAIDRVNANGGMFFKIPHVSIIR